MRESCGSFSRVSVEGTVGILHRGGNSDAIQCGIQFFATLAIQDGEGMPNRSALFINLSLADARTIRGRAKLDHRNVSAYVLHILMRAVATDETSFSRLSRLQGLPTKVLTPMPQSPQTTVLLRCSTEEAQRIRVAARRRETTISGFVLHFLQSSWTAENRARTNLHWAKGNASA